jgi:hypothetical protein
MGRLRRGSVKVQLLDLVGRELALIDAHVAAAAVEDACRSIVRIVIVPTEIKRRVRLRNAPVVTVTTITDDTPMPAGSTYTGGTIRSGNIFT